jgi:hypothetical protein
MVAKDFPCKTCSHGAEQHFTNASNDTSICVWCSGGETGTRFIEADEYYHAFEGDNLKFMELQKKKQELMSE